MSAKIAVVYYSLYGHTHKLAEEVAVGIKEGAPNATVEIYQVAETLSDDVVAKMHGAPKASHPVIAVNKLADFDGIAWGIPTRYGRAANQVSALFDQTGGLWAKGALIGKFATVFTGSGTQHGGQETTALTTIPFFVHQGINYVPIGYACPVIADNSEIVGGSPWGAASISSSDGSRPVSAKELEVAKFQGKHFGTTVATFVKGKTAGTSAAKALPASLTVDSTVATANGSTQADSEKPVNAADSKPYDVKDTVTPVAKGGEGAAPVQQQQKKGGLAAKLATCCGGGHSMES